MGSTREHCGSHLPPEPAAPPLTFRGADQKWNPQWRDVCGGGPPPDTAQIGDRAFVNCRGLTQITLPPGLTHIGDDAFLGCSGLTQITLPPGVALIGAGAFYGARG